MAQVGLDWRLRRHRRDTVVKELDPAELMRLMDEMRRLRRETAAELARVQKTFLDIAEAVEKIERSK